MQVPHCPRCFFHRMYIHKYILSKLLKTDAHPNNCSQSKCSQKFSQFLNHYKWRIHIFIGWNEAKSFLYMTYMYVYTRSVFDNHIHCGSCYLKCTKALEKTRAIPVWKVGHMQQWFAPLYSADPPPTHRFSINISESNLDCSLNP